MKKMIAMAFVAITMMTSCSDDDSSNTNDPEEFGLLPKQITYTYGNGDVSTTTYNYDGNKITGYTATGGYDVDYTYTNGFLTKIVTHMDSDFIGETTFTYDDNNKLATRVTMNPDGDGMFAMKIVYTHNNDGTITLTYFSGDEEEQTESLGSNLITMENGNITSITLYELDGSVNYTTYFTFDNKYSAFKNVFANDILVLSEGRGGVNNILTSILSPFPDHVLSSEYTYNSEDLPVTQTMFDDGEMDTQIEYTYE